MQEGAKRTLEAESFLPESARDVGDIMGKLAVRTATVALQVETAWLTLSAWNAGIAQIGPIPSLGKWGLMQVL